MRTYSNKISLLKNSRGIYSLDTIMGCKSGMQNETNGCYNECYSAKSAKLYGYDFSKNVLRDFENEHHRRSIMLEINNSKLDFIRIGSNGDPSEDWEHTINVIKKIDKCNKQIVIITRHWNNLTIKQLQYFSTINVCINTSISALDKDYVLENCLNQYKLIKNYCKSILRVVTCDFNEENEDGNYYNMLQNNLLKNDGVIETILRISKNNVLYKNNVIHGKKTKFLGKNVIISKNNKKTYFGNCNNCLEMCGLNVDVKHTYKSEIPLIKQLKLF